MARLRVEKVQEAIKQELSKMLLMDIKDPRKSDRIEFIGGQNALKKIEEVSKKSSVIAFTLFPTSTKEIVEITDKNLFMPPKSTWFEPKLRSGIFVHLFD